MDLQQILKIRRIIGGDKNEEHYTKQDLEMIELDTIVQVFEEETFFTIFAEQAEVYDAISDQLHLALLENQQNEMEDERIFQKVVRRLKIVVDRPTPVWVKQIG